MLENAGYSVLSAAVKEEADGEDLRSFGSMSQSVGAVHEMQEKEHSHAVEHNFNPVSSFKRDVCINDSLTSCTFIFGDLNLAFP